VPVSRARSAHMLAPIDGLLGVDTQRRLGEITFSTLSSTLPDRDSVLSGVAVQASLEPGMVVVSLSYGQLTRGDAAGTRVLIKTYSSDENNALASARTATALERTPEGRMRDRLEVMTTRPPDGGTLGMSGSGDDDVGNARRSLEASLSSEGGISLAELMAENEFAAHARVQALVADVEKDGLCRLLGRLCPDYREGEPQLILHIFPWRGDQARLAMPTRLPATLASWARARSRGETPGAKLWKGVPLRACQQRGRFVRSAMEGALRGLATLHRCQLVHQGLSPSAISISTEDDRKGEVVVGRLMELAFCRDTSSLALAYSVGADGQQLFDAEDPLDTGLRERAMLLTLRPGDPEERAAFAKANDVREFGFLLLQMMLLPFAQPSDDAMTVLKLRSLCDGPFMLPDSDGDKTDGVDVRALRDYLDADESIRDGGVGGVDVLDLADGAGWDLLAALLDATWQDRPSAEEALMHPFWSAKMAM